MKLHLSSTQLKIGSIESYLSLVHLKIGIIDLKIDTIDLNIDTSTKDLKIGTYNSIIHRFNSFCVIEIMNAPLRDLIVKGDEISNEYQRIGTFMRLTQRAKSYLIPNLSMNTANI